MASIKRPFDGDGKASSLDSLFSRSPHTGRAAHDAGDRHRKFGPDGPESDAGRKKNYSWLVDVTILLLIVGIAVAVYFYIVRPILSNYNEIWDETTLICTIELSDIDPSLVEYERDGTLSAVGEGIYALPSAEADCIGTVTDGSITFTMREDGSEAVTMLLTVEADVRFRSGEGYIVGETRLLCGEERTFRLWGLSADGCILTMQEKED